MIETLVRAFPTRLHAAASEVVGSLPASDYEPAGDIATTYKRACPGLRLGSEQVSIPCRIYNPRPEQSLLQQLDDERSLVLSCIYSRHHDGFVRQEFVSRILASDDACIIPFVVQLLGEYVVEICADVERFVLERLPTRPNMVQGFATFLADNPCYAALTEQRATSYWSCYCRRQYPSRQSYPGLVALDALRTTA
ncbi:hypothetical protein ACIA58_16780 [Kribbella sp. NPDC051586]|uniref:hypothetical protein n=1 Tax=Kribbella sp. NPDC051586 TaxID=3364118 RepID=UPI0037B4F116